MEDNYVGERLAAILMEKEISERQMSLALGRSAGYINKITRGNMNLSVAELLYICDYLQITPSEFFDDKDLLSQDEAAICNILRTFSKDDLILVKGIVELIKKRNYK